MNSSSATLFFVVFAFFSNAHILSSGQEFDAVRAAWIGISDVLKWAKGLKTLTDRESEFGLHHAFGSNSARIAVGECVNLYEASETRLARLAFSREYSRHDAAAWLSAGFSSNRGCLDGLKEKGLLLDTSLAQNLSELLQKALASVVEKGDTDVGKPSPTGEEGDEAILAAWNPTSFKANFVVAKDGSGQYKTINDALKAVAASGSSRPNRTIIYVKSGVYNEQVKVDSALTNLAFIGDGIGRTIVTDNKNGVGGIITFNTATFGVYGDGFWGRDMTFVNTAGPENGQAVALGVLSDQAVFYRCSFEGYQDTLLVWQLRQFYRNCQIHGTVDYVFGYGSAVFQNCDFIVRKPLTYQFNVITAQGRDSPHAKTGFVIMDSRVRPDHGFAPFKRSIKSYLGRPWQPYARVLYIRTDLDDLVAPEGWTEYNGGSEISTLYFAECRNTGKGADKVNRVKWPGFHVYKHDADVEAFSVKNFIQGDEWIPASGVPFSSGI